MSTSLERGQKGINFDKCSTTFKSLTSVLHTLSHSDCVLVRERPKEGVPSHPYLSTPLSSPSEMDTAYESLRIVLSKILLGLVESILQKRLNS